MLKPHLLEFLWSKLGYKPLLDLCADCCGYNSLAPLFYDARADALLQLEYIEGEDMIVNPPYDRIPEFIELLEEAYTNDKTTTAVLIIPRR